MSSGMIYPDVDKLSVGQRIRKGKLFFADLLHKKTISLGVLALSGLCRGAALIIVTSTQNVSVQFISEYFFLIVFSFILEIAELAVKKVIPFRAIHILRFIMLAAIFRILGGQFLSVPILLTIPFIIDGTLYDDNRVAAWFNACCLVFFSAGFCQQLFKNPPSEVFTFVITYVISSAAVCTFAHLLKHYREILAGNQKQLSSLRSAIANLSDANREFQIYADNMQSESAEKERNRITRDMHDTIGYALTNVIIMMKAGKVLLRENPDELEKMFDKIKIQTEEALDETRHILHRLREIRPFSPKGLRAAQHLVNSFQEATDISVTINTGNLPWSFGKRLDSAVYHLIQEGLTNSFRHGHADSVRINLWQAPEEIRVNIWDNGSGLTSGKNLITGIGIEGMRERFAIFGGNIEARNVADGFMLSATIPYKIGDIRG